MISRARNGRRPHLRDRQARSLRALLGRLLAWSLSWPVLLGVALTAGVAATVMFGTPALPYSVGQRIDQPIYARVDFEVPDPKQTQTNREAARALVPSYYILNNPALCFDRIRADLMLLYQTALDSPSFEEFAAAMQARGWPAEQAVYQRLRNLADEESRKRYSEWVNALRLEDEYVVRDLSREERVPAGAADYIILERTGADGQVTPLHLRRLDLVSQASDKALLRSAEALTARFPYEVREARATIQAVILATLREQPTIVYNQERTLDQMARAEAATPEVFARYERGKVIVTPEAGGVTKTLTSADYALLELHQAAFLKYLEGPTPEAAALRRTRLLERVGLVAILALLAAALLTSAAVLKSHLMETRGSSLALAAVVLATVVAGRALNLKWPQIPELIYAPCLLAGSILALVHGRAFAAGVVTILAMLLTVTARADLAWLLALLAGVAVSVAQLGDVRSRTKIIAVGGVTALVMAAVTAAGALWNRQPLEYIWQHALWAGAGALLAAFLVSGLLPFIESIFGAATSLTLLEWSDSRRPLLQLLAREAPGTYQHSLVLGTLAENACAAIGANGLLAQVGALYHDIGKIPKSQYFVENQEGRINWHDSLAPTMSLLIILGHVKDGLELARQYKLPRVLHQFIAEHHGTTVVKYFHHRASEKQPLIASGKHDREVPEAEFRYRGPKPRSRESVVLMLCDGCEGAVRALPEVTIGRIEQAVHQVVTDRLNDGQFDECDMTLREIRLVEDALVQSLRRHYHGRVAYPKKAAAPAPSAQQEGVG
ncbi:MAG TPA: HDIG domain-containing protein [Phycisphaerae bacterium]|nr:HDIG domain-containing protein [Phycisphaerae bacterium]HNU46134.1 HDIG domain-containing protein [Phycisphaerae bacterium]